MSGIEQPISSFGTENPQYYAELFCKTFRLGLAHRRIPSDEQFCLDVPGSIQGVDHPLTRRLQTLLDTVADISLCERGNVSATTACVKDDKGTLETQLYIVFNHKYDEEALRCPQHLQNIFKMLRQVPYRPMDASPKVIANDLENDYIGVCRAIHNYSFDIFAYRVTKRKHKLSDIRRYIELDQTDFTLQDRSTLVTFLQHVDMIITNVAYAETTKQLPATSIKLFLNIYSYWTKHDLLPKDSLADEKVTLLDRADTWLAKNYDIGFQLRRWALKIMSFLISANRLFILTQSTRLHKLIQGKFSVQVLPSPNAAPYCCDLSSETVRVTLEAALAETGYLSADWDQDRESFIVWLLKELKVSEVVRLKPTVHAELAMIMAIANDDIKHVLPYVGVSKLSCIMCSHYIHAFNEVAEQKIATKGSRGKAYPGWSWPSLRDSDRDKELVPAVLKRLRRQLFSDFKEHTEKRRRLSDSSVGSGGPEWEIEPTIDGINELFTATIPEPEE